MGSFERDRVAAAKPPLTDTARNEDGCDPPEPTEDIAPRGHGRRTIYQQLRQAPPVRPHRYDPEVRAPVNDPVERLDSRPVSSPRFEALRFEPLRSEPPPADAEAPTPDEPRAAPHPGPSTAELVEARQAAHAAAQQPARVPALPSSPGLPRPCRVLV